VSIQWLISVDHAHMIDWFDHFIRNVSLALCGAQCHCPGGRGGG